MKSWCFFFIYLTFQNKIQISLFIDIHRSPWMQTDAVFILSHSNITHSISTGNMVFWKDNSVKFQIKQSVSYFDLSRSCFSEKLPSGIFLEGVTHLPKSYLYVNQNEGLGADTHKQLSTAWFNIWWEVRFKLVWGKSSCLMCCGTSSISRTCLLLKKNFFGRTTQQVRS